MAENSKIEWTDTTWNPIAGCSPISPGCTNCYAATMARRLEAMGQAKYRGTAERRGSVDVFTGKVNFEETALTAPLTWKKPRRIFVNSMSDLFHESLPFDWIRKVLDVCVQGALQHGHTFQILTKRADRMVRDVNRYINDGHLCGAGPFCRDVHSKVSHSLPPGIWLGVSVEDQRRADERIPHLLATPAAIRFLSCEPLLGPVDLRTGIYAYATPSGGEYRGTTLEGIDWVIVGGESGHHARPCVIGHVRELVKQCAAAGVSCFVKQLGSNPVNREGQSHPSKDKKGGDWSEWPEDLRVRQFPEVVNASL